MLIAQRIKEVVMLRNAMRVAGIVVVASGLCLPLAAGARRPYRAPDPHDVAATACAGIRPSEAPPLRRELLESVTPLYQRTRSGKHLAGATVTIRAGAGLTADQLQRIFDCQIARCVLAPAFEGCPLATEGVRVRVVSEADHFLVQIWSDDAAAGRQILARTESLRQASEH